MISRYPIQLLTTTAFPADFDRRANGAFYAAGVYAKVNRGINVDAFGNPSGRCGIYHGNVDGINQKVHTVQCPVDMETPQDLFNLQIKAVVFQN